MGVGLSSYKDLGQPLCGQFRGTTPRRRYIIRWDVSSSPILGKGVGKNDASDELRFEPNLRCFRQKPTSEQIGEFVAHTDFGNNDISSHTSAASAIRVRVVQVVVYPGYSDLAKLLDRGLSKDEIASRVPAYDAAIRKSMAETRIL